MLKGQANEISKDIYNKFQFELEKQLLGESSFSEVQKKRKWNVKPSKFAINTTNPIRAIVEHLNVQPNPDKAFIPLSVGE